MSLALTPAHPWGMGVDAEKSSDLLLLQMTVINATLSDTNIVSTLIESAF